MNNHQNKTWDAYDRCSDHFFQTYKKIYFSNVHRSIIKFLPSQAAAKILDIGCGSGRDAMALANRGYKVTAVDPSIKMLHLAETQDTHGKITWINDALPELKSLENTPFSFILLSAVWMHIPPQQRDRSIQRISELLETDGHLAITLRIGEQDPSRIMHPVSLEELLTLSLKYKLHQVYISRPTKDSLNRNGINWRKVVLKKLQTDSN